VTFETWVVNDKQTLITYYHNLGPTVIMLYRSP